MASAPTTDPPSAPSALAALGLGTSLDLIDELYERWRGDPGSVDAGWASLFAGEGAIATSGNGRPAAPAAASASPGRAAPALPLDRVFQLVAAYRTDGHLEAKLDPLEQQPVVPRPHLLPGFYGLRESDLDQPVPTLDVHGLPPDSTLRDLLARLRATYCGSIGVELMHISDAGRRGWLMARMEPAQNRPSLDRATRMRILDRLAAAEVFERFIHTRWVGAKRFGLDGAEALIPLLDLLLERTGEQGASEVILGMAHRGRLNVLSNILGKSAGDIFTEFEDVDPESTLGGGDVKYHLGFSNDHITRGGARLHLSLAFNPSHLEAVDPVVTGRVRAKQLRRGDGERRQVVGVLIHGDAAFAGQGLVAETLQLSQLPGYRTGGTVHVIVNNQIGFTTDPSSSRSTSYCTDIAKMIECPIFHVNGEDAEAVAQVVHLAADYRHQFQCDVVIDLVCFRRYGHNESDEPAFTQPLLYRKIADHPPLRVLYGRELVGKGVCTQAEVDQLVADRMAIYEAEYARAKSAQARPRIVTGEGVWAGYAGGPDASVPEVETGVDRARLVEIAERIAAVPEGFHPHPKIARLLQERAAMGRGERPIEWNLGELLAFGSLLWDGTLVRLSGQDSRRGTFSQRHAVLTDVDTGATFAPLGHLHPRQGRFAVYDSPLSEAAVLGFDFGFSLDWPDALVIWEAQFGDFVNGAQVILDQFLASSEDKWKRISGLTLFLPHGFEGQGPEHSSARFERFLQLCAEDNLQVCQPSNAAQLFHMLRRQVLRPWRKPLVVMTPKSLLRGPRAASPLSDFTGGHFQRVLCDAPVPEARIERLFFCTGKVCYDLAEERARRGATDVGIVRIEQLYPLPEERLAEVVARFPNARELVWVQDEPENMGARNFVLPLLWRVAAGRPLRSASRAGSASPATGSAKAHAIEQRQLLDAAFASAAADAVRDR